MWPSSVEDGWRQWRKLNWSERWLVVEALALLLLTALELLLFGLRRWRSAFARQDVPDKLAAGGAGESTYHLMRLATKVVMRAAGFGPYRANCLQQSLVLWRLLHRRGIQGQLRIGIQKQADCFRAHAWVEYLGVALNESEGVDKLFTPLDPLSSSISKESVFIGIDGDHLEKKHLRGGGTKTL